jgi:cysteine sulfinate desulfinase/cysteine desulfurase-like protein
VRAERESKILRGICEAALSHGRHIITSAIEHPSVRGSIEEFEKKRHRKRIDHLAAIVDGDVPHEE